MSRFSEEMKIIPRPARIIAVVAALIVPFAARRLCRCGPIEPKPWQPGLGSVRRARWRGRNADGFRIRPACRLYRRGCTPTGNESRAVGFACDLHTQRHRYHSVLHPSGSTSATLLEVRSRQLTRRSRSARFVEKRFSKTCPGCHGAVQPGWSHCARCGASLPGA